MTPTLEEVAYRLLPMVQPGRALADSEWTTLRSAVEVLLSGAVAQPAPEQVANNIESFLIKGRSQRAWRVRVLLTLLEYLPIPSCGDRFSRLDVELRRRLVEERMIGGRYLWGVCAKVRVLVIMGFYGDRTIQPLMGFVPVPLRKRYTSQEASIGTTGLTQ